MIESRKIKLLKWIAGISVIFIMLGISAVTVFAAGDVSSAIQNTWNSAQTQIKNVVNNVVFPAVDMILAILFLSNLQPHIWITASTDSLNLRRLQFFSAVLCSR